MKKKIDNLNNLFEKSLKDIESKMKELFLNEIKIKENVKTIKNLENKNIYLDNAIKDKKTELNILKQLLVLKEKKKLNFEFIISKCLSEIKIPEDKNEEKNQNLINRKKVNSLLEDFNKEFNYYLNMDNKKSKKKLHRYKSDLFNKELLKKNHEDFINMNKKDYINNNKNIISDNQNKVRNISEKNDKNNLNLKINYEGNKNLKKSRENLEYYFLKNIKEKQSKMDKISFIKLIFLKINTHKNNINKEIFSKLLLIYKLNKLKDFLNYMNIKRFIISTIKTIITKSSEIYNINKNQEIINDDEFLGNIILKKYNEIESKNKIKNYKNGLEKMKNINNQIYEVNLKLINFIEKIKNSD
jgi:hypothetical protein